MIKSFRHKGLQLFFETANRSGIQSNHAARLARQLSRLNEAKSWADMNLPGWRLHLLRGKSIGHYSVVVSGNWRMTFTFEGEYVVLIDYLDYH
jgi:proteic killer suppression protein